MYEIRNNTIVKTDLIESSVEVSSKNIEEQINSIEALVQSLSMDLEVLKKDLDVVLELEKELNKK